MSSDYEYSDEDADYYDDDEEMMDTQEDGQRDKLIQIFLESD
jgi:ariadne-1